MKKAIVLLIALLLVAAVAVVAVVIPRSSNEKIVGAAAAEESTSDETGSKFERIMLKKGSLIVKEFLDCCVFAEDSYTNNDSMFFFTDSLKFQRASITDIETGSEYLAVRITTGYYTSQYSNGEAIGVMDADEVDGAIKALQYIKENINSLKDYSEIVYKASSGMEVGAYYSSTESKIYVKINSNATKFYSTVKIDELIKAFETVKATF